MKKCIDFLEVATVFSKLDANSGYWQVETDEKDCDKRAFTSRHGHFGMNRMPFGLRNSPGAFQLPMDVTLLPVRWQFALVYLGDIVILSKPPEQRIYHLRKGLKVL